MMGANAVSWEHQNAATSATPGDHDGVRDQIEMPLDQIAPDGRQAGKRADGGIVAPSGVIDEKTGPGVLSRTGEDRVGVGGRLLGSEVTWSPPRATKMPLRR